MYKANTINTNIIAQGDLFSLSCYDNRKVEVSFTSPDTSSYGGLLLLREAEQQTGIIESLCKCMTDNRHEGYISHTYKEMLTQRILQIAAGYEDADDCDLLRKDSIFKMCTSRPLDSSALASQPTMSRFENQITKEDLYKIACCFVSLFMASYESAPKVIVLDIDDSNFNTYGNQQYTLFNNYYDEHCYMPFFIFEGLSGKLILPLLRPGRRSKDLNIYGVLRRVIEILRRYWKKTCIIIRGDSHFCSDSLMTYCEKGKNLFYIIGMIGLNPLKKKVAHWVEHAQEKYKRYSQPVRMYRSLSHGAVIWNKKRRVIVKINVDQEGTSVRFIITNFSLDSRPRHLYERVYIQRGTMELYIKEVKCHLMGRRMSCSKFQANQFRLFLHGAAYLLMHSLKTNAFAHTAFESATMITIRQKLLLISVHIKVYKTKVKIELPVNYPHKEEFTRSLLLFEHLRFTG